MPGRGAGEGLAPEGLLCWALLDPKVRVAHPRGSHPVGVMFNIRPHAQGCPRCLTLILHEDPGRRHY